MMQNLRKNSVWSNVMLSNTTTECHIELCQCSCYSAQVYDYYQSTSTEPVQLVSNKTDFLG